MHLHDFGLPLANSRCRELLFSQQTLSPAQPDIRRAIDKPDDSSSPFRRKDSHMSHMSVLSIEMISQYSKLDDIGFDGMSADFDTVSQCRPSKIRTCTDASGSL
jgi:hypothetical protein